MVEGAVGSPHSLLRPGDEGMILFWYDVGPCHRLKGMEPDDHRLETSKLSQHTVFVCKLIMSSIVL